MSESIDPEQEARELAQIKQRGSRLNAKPIGSIVRQLMTRSGYGQTQASSDLNASWAAAVGNQLAEHSRPGNISRGVLTVHVSDSATLQELYFQKRHILAALRQSMPTLILKDLRTRVTKLD
ncbi:MAG: DUF721 domain-containing protein [Planctomycetales bacterium]|nr:DUF721 domain-containing protein [Planctomycetales bacterium]